MTDVLAIGARQFETQVADARGLRPVAPLKAIVPAYNEAAHVADTVHSLLGQSVPPARVLVVDDCSTDDTARVAIDAGAEVIAPPRNTGSKAGAQIFGLRFVATRLVMALDADTVLAPDAIERILPVLDEDHAVAAACGFVLPRRVSSIWERGRYIEYLYSFTFLKQVQDFYGKPLISSGCFSVYRTEALRSVGGWSNRTMAEDMDLTWTFYEHGFAVRFVSGAVCHPVEPQTLRLLSKQLRRWSAGFLQNVRCHWRGIVHFGYLRSVVGVACWVALVGAAFWFLALPLLAALVTPFFLAGYIIDAPVLLVPVLVGGLRRREVGRALSSFPALFVLRLVNAVFMIHAFWREVVLRRPLLVYEKGH